MANGIIIESPLNFQGSGFPHEFLTGPGAR
jgi:hypothetical protein